MNGGYKVGFHVSIAGGISNSVDNAKGMGCSAFQIFSRNPRGWAAKPLDTGDVATFKQKLAASGIDRDSIAVHMPYLPNLSGPPGENYMKSVATLAGELERSGELGIPFLVIHLGSHKDKGVSAGIDQLVGAIQTARDKAKKRGQVMVLLENNAGQKNNVGGNFQELRTILDRLGVNAGVCIDTCHAFASGYDIRTAEGVEKTLAEFDKAVGFKELRMIHLNDSKGELGCNLDRHDHIGLGYIGKGGLSAFVRHKAVKKLPIIMETPIDGRRDDAGNLKAFLELVT